VAAVAAAIAAGGNPNVRGDAVTAALLAAAGSRAAAALVRINLADADADDRPARAERLAAGAALLAAEAEKTAREARHASTATLAAGVRSCWVSTARGSGPPVPRECLFAVQTR
jgi:hypothetical protein